jgi:tetratricopeptide (TPR) repeat protein
MKDKNLILAEARQKAEAKLEKLRPKAMLYTLVGIGCGIFAGIVGSLVMARLFPFNFVLVIVFPIVAYIAAKRHVKQHILHYADEAVKILDKEPQDDRDYWDRADILSSYGFHEAAVDDYRSALEIESDEELNGDIWYDLAVTLWELRRRDEALPIAEKLSVKEGDYQGLALALQGKILAEDDPTAALKCFDKAIEIEPKYFYHRLSRIRFFLDGNRLDEAADAIEKTEKMLI